MIQQACVSLNTGWQRHVPLTRPHTPSALLSAQSEFDARRNYIKPRPTGATQGHALGALRTMEAAAEAGGKQQHRAKQWKMPRFESKAAPRIDTCKHHACSQQRAHHEQAGAQ
jgi:hypothetical protein